MRSVTEELAWTITHMLAWCCYRAIEEGEADSTSKVGEQITLAASLVCIWRMCGIRGKKRSIGLCSFLKCILDLQMGKKIFFFIVRMNFFWVVFSTFSRSRRFGSIRVLKLPDRMNHSGSRYVCTLDRMRGCRRFFWRGTLRSRKICDSRGNGKMRS
jgi:hypothetical protein